MTGRLFALAILAGAASVYAAEPTGTITGTVTDPSGAAIPGAKITATASETISVMATVPATRGRAKRWPSR